jgi:adenosine deaminase
MSLSKPPLDAIEALTPSQVDFLKALPKAELHAHLNGSIPLPVLQQLAEEYVSSGTDTDPTVSAIQAGIEKLQGVVVLDEIHDFFTLFPAIYALTSTKGALARVSHAVLAEFLEPKDGEAYPQATYLELRSTPKETPEMTRLEYIETVLDEVEKYRPDQAALIVSLDRRMSTEVADDCVEAVITLKKRGRRVVGVDLCGVPTVSNSWTHIVANAYSFTGRRYETLCDTFCGRQSRWIGCHTPHRRGTSLSLLARPPVLTMVQTPKNTPEDTLILLSFKPDRLGHATFLNDEAQEVIIRDKMAIEICLTSNLL